MLEQLRQLVVTDLLNLRTVKRCWPAWASAIHDLLGSRPDPDTVLGLGDHLSEIFQSTSTAGRSQSELSGGGAAWEALVAWYLNLVTVNTASLTVKKGGHTPRPVRQALAVKYGNKKTNTEADLVSVTLPDGSYPRSLFSAAPVHSFDELSRVCEEQFSRLQVTVIQCKTNWNDNAQVPMLWDMVYRASGFADRNITVGENAYSLRNTTFKYAFATVPTTDPNKITPNSMAVLRVAGLSGGNYWGRPTVNGVASSIKEIFSNARIGPQDIRGAISAALTDRAIPGYFQIG